MEIEIDRLKIKYLLLKIVEKYEKINIAYSGGIDSHVLLHFVYNISLKLKILNKLTAIHINHNVSPNAYLWEKHCRKICTDLGINYISIAVEGNIKINKISTEDNLRKLRYKALSQMIYDNNTCLITAHHADDQAETLLLQLFRGAGIKGLSAMPSQIKYGTGWLLRPFLICTRKAIIEYAHYHKLQWIEDESNQNIAYYRNYLRNCIIPEIKKKWPGIISTLNRVSRNCSEASELSEYMANSDLQYVIDKNDCNLHTLYLQKLQQLSITRQKNLLRWWLYRFKLLFPSEAIIKEIIRTIIYSKYDANPEIKWTEIIIRRCKNKIYITINKV